MTRKTRKTFAFTIETTAPPGAAQTPISPQGPWGATWLLVRAAAVLVSMAHIAVLLR